MVRTFASVIAVGLVAVGCSDAAMTATTRPPTKPPTTIALAVGDPLCERTSSSPAELPLPPDLAGALDPVVAEGMAAMDAVGLTFAVQCAGSPVYVEAYGSADLADGVPATEDTIYEIGSVTKQFVAAVVLNLAQEDRLSLDDPIGMYLSSLPTDWQQVTLEQLLSHTGGVPDHFAIFGENPDTPFDWTRDYSSAELVEAFLVLDDQLIASPGTVFSYSNTDYAMLAAVIEGVMGGPLALALDESLFSPLGLDQTAFCSPSLPDLAVGYNIGPDGPIPGPEVPADFYSGAAGICSSAGDLVRWQRQMVDGAAVGLEAFQAMASPATLNDGTPVPYGLGLHLDELGGNEAIFHEGGTAAFSSWLAYYPDKDLIVAILSNTLGPNPIGIRDLVIEVANAATAP